MPYPYWATRIPKFKRWDGGEAPRSKNTSERSWRVSRKGCPKSMKTKFDFVNIAGNAFNTITDDLIDREYEVNVSAATAA